MTKPKAINRKKLVAFVLPIIRKKKLPMSEELEKLRHKQYVAERKLTAAKHRECQVLRRWQLSAFTRCDEVFVSKVIHNCRLLSSSDMTVMTLAHWLYALRCHIFYVFFLKYRVISIAHIDSLLSNTCLIDCIPEQNYLVFEKITHKNFWTFYMANDAFLLSFANRFSTF